MPAPRGSRRGPPSKVSPSGGRRVKGPASSSRHLSVAQQRELARAMVGRVSAKFDRYKDNVAFSGTRMQVLTASDPRMPKIYSTGILSVDVSTHVGGFPGSRVTLLHGPESAAKTVVLVKKLAHTQSLGGLSMLIDCERKLNFKWAATLGLDVEALIYIRPKSIEAGFVAIEEYLTDLRKSGYGEDDVPFDIGWDSLHAGRSAKTVVAGFEGIGYSPESKAYSDCVTLVKDLIDDTSASFTAISQVRMNIGATKYEPQTKIGVGKQVLHAASLIGVFSVKRFLGSKRHPAGQDTKVVWKKNHCARPFGVGCFRIYDDVGVDRAFSAFSAAKAVELGFTKGGVRLELESGVHRVKSEDDMYDLLNGSPELLEEVEESVRERIGHNVQIDHGAAAKGEVEDVEDLVEEDEEDVVPDIDDE